MACEGVGLVPRLCSSVLTRRLASVYSSVQLAFTNRFGRTGHAMWHIKSDRLTSSPGPCSVHWKEMCELSLLGAPNFVDWLV